MIRRKRLILGGLIGVAALCVLVSITAVMVVRTTWFSNFARERIISSTEESTGGKVEVGSFSFDTSHLRAVITNFMETNRHRPIHS
jgi:hypothetical protein